MARTRPYRVAVAVAVWGPISDRPNAADDEIIKSSTLVQVYTLEDARQLAGEVLARVERSRDSDPVAG